MRRSGRARSSRPAGRSKCGAEPTVSTTIPTCRWAPTPLRKVSPRTANRIQKDPSPVSSALDELALIFNFRNAIAAIGSIFQAVAIHHGDDAALHLQDAPLLDFG